MRVLALIQNCCQLVAGPVLQTTAAIIYRWHKQVVPTPSERIRVWLGNRVGSQLLVISALAVALHRVPVMRQLPLKLVTAVVTRPMRAIQQLPLKLEMAVVLELTLAELRLPLRLAMAVVLKTFRVTV